MTKRSPKRFTQGPPPGRARGIALVVVLALLLVTLLAGVLIASNVQTESRIAHNDRVGKQALAHAQAGIEHAVQLLKANYGGNFGPAFNCTGPSDCSTTGGTMGGLQNLSGEGEVTVDGRAYRTRTFAGGSYDVRIDDNYDDTPNDPAVDTDNKAIITSLGFMGTAVRKLEGLVTLKEFTTTVPGSGWPYGMFGINKVTISGGSTAYGPVGGGEVAVGSSSDVTVSSSYVHGLVEAGDTVTCSGSCQIYDEDGNLCYDGDGAVIPGTNCVQSGLGDLGTFETESNCHEDLNPDGTVNESGRYSPDADDGIDSVTNNIYTVNLDADAADAFLRSDTPQPVTFNSVADWYTCATSDFDADAYDPAASTAVERAVFCSDEQPVDYSSSDGKMEHGGRVVVAKSGSYCFSKLTLSGGAQLFLDVSDGPIIIRVTDQVAASGGSTINGQPGGNFFVTSGDPTDVFLISSVNKNVAVSGGSHSAMMIYSPLAKIALSSGSGNYTGGALGWETTLSGGGEFHYGGSSGGTVTSYQADLSTHEVPN